MKIEEACEIIGEFEFGKKVELCDHHVYIKDYTEEQWRKGTHAVGYREYSNSLDQLMVICKKIKASIKLDFEKEFVVVQTKNFGANYGTDLYPTMEQCAAVCIAKTISYLKEQNEKNIDNPEFI